VFFCTLALRRGTKKEDDEGHVCRESREDSKSCPFGSRFGSGLVVDDVLAWSVLMSVCLGFVDSKLVTRKERQSFGASAMSSSLVF